MTRRDKARAALAAEGWSLPLDIVPIDLLLDTKSDALDIIAERDSLRAEVERLTADLAALEARHTRVVDAASVLGDELNRMQTFEARIRAEERAKIAAWIRGERPDLSATTARWAAVVADIVERGDFDTNNEHDAP